jgi:glycosyltransferase 2 family protein
MDVARIRSRLLLSMLFGIVVFAGLLAYGDFRHVGDDLRAFRWELMPLILLVTLGNYLLRFVKWEYYLRQIGVTGLKRIDSFLIYFSGLGMTVTPGKIGEWLKSYLLKEIHGTPVTKSAPILLAERLTDGLGLLIIGIAGLAVFGHEYWPIAAIFAGGSLLVIAVSRHRPSSRALLRLAGRLPIVSRFVPHFEEFYESTYVVMEPRGVALMTGLSVGSWFFEVLAFYLTLIGLGVDASLDTLFKAAFILPIATLAAAALLTPGGLGVAEIGITGLTKRLLHISKDTATVGTLIVRIATLWFGVMLGLAMFAVLARRLARQGKRLDGADSADGGDADGATLAGDPAA